MHERVKQAVALARALQERATELQTHAERRQQAELDRMLQTPSDKVTLMQITDQAFRAKRAARTVDQFTHILDVQGIPRFFSPMDRALLHGFHTFGGWLPGVAAPMVKDRMQHETANVILPAETEPLTEHLRERTASGLRMNVNFLGEALLGEDEARQRLEKYLAALQLPEIEVISVKISTIYSQISALARDHTVSTLCDRLELLFREAAHLRFTRPDGTQVPKFIYLDMEEYRDMRLTAEAFMRTLERSGLEQASAGIALQAYIPDSAAVLRELVVWAKKRVQAGGAPVMVRIVKGANMEMERVEASLRGWPQAPFETKRETDANYKRMLEEVMENLEAVHVGVASHNLFDLAYGLLLATEHHAGDRVQFEMLHGMANHQRRALFEHTRRLLLYAPACRREEFVNAIGYLIRRLDENTGADNFLRHAFRLRVGSPEWKKLKDDFCQAFETKVNARPRRRQNRQVPPGNAAAPEMDWQRLVNEPDTDFALPQNSAWAAQLVATGAKSANWGEEPPRLVGESRECLDRSRYGTVLWRYHEASAEDVRRAIDLAAQDPFGWRALRVDERNAVLGQVAQEIRKARGDLILSAIANDGKTFGEADPEVSEAVDFLEFYRNSARFFFALPGVKASSKGVVVVVSPWNFPIAIPCGGVAAALAAGNTVILKPSSDAVLVAHVLCQCFWRAGVPRPALQLLPCAGGGSGRLLVADTNVRAVILTGGTETALRMVQDRPEMPLFAETGGKNATIVTALSDREQAIKNVVHSAFSHSGQKCSATSLLLLEAEVYDDPVFKRTLCDAVESLSVGSAWDLPTRVGPLIRPPSGALEEALKTLEPGESWAVLPRAIGGNPQLWAPGVKWGVSPGSTTHMTELFGPVLGVMRFRSLDEAIALVNQTGYGLTSGLESLDDREQRTWKSRIRAGNLYINRPTTGAIVLRQPFGGMGKSSFGPAMKAGGPNYVMQFMDFADTPAEKSPGTSAGDWHSLDLSEMRADDGEKPRLMAALASYDLWWQNEFSREHDHFALLGEDNIRRYLPLREIRLRVHPDDSWFEILARAGAARRVGARVVTSIPPASAAEKINRLEKCTEAWAGAIEFLEESDTELAKAIREGTVERVRFAAPERVPVEVRVAAAAAGIYLADAPVLAQGRIELLWYLREQSVSHLYHRYGNLGARAAGREGIGNWPFVAH